DYLLFHSRTVHNDRVSKAAKASRLGTLPRRCRLFVIDWVMNCPDESYALALERRDLCPEAGCVRQPPEPALSQKEGMLPLNVKYARPRPTHRPKKTHAAVACDARPRDTHTDA